MRNHLISVAIGFALGGLVLVPLTLQLHDPADEATAGVTALPGHQPNQISPESPRRERAAPHKAIQPAPNGFKGSQIATAPPAPSESDAAANPAPDATRRFVLFLPPLPQRPNVPLTSFELCMTAPANTWTASSSFSREGPALFPTWGLARSGWTGAGPTPADRVALPADINLREDYRERLGLIAAMQMANIPRQDDELVAFVPPTLRLSDRPAASLPQTQPRSTLFNRPQAGNEISDPFVTVAVPQSPAVRSPVTPAVPTSPVSPVAESPAISVRPSGLGNSVPPTNTIGTVPLGAGAPGSNSSGAGASGGSTGGVTSVPIAPSAPASGSGATGSGLPIVGAPGTGSMGSGGGGSGGSNPIAPGGTGSSSGTGGSPPDPRTPGDGAPPGTGNPVTFTGGWNPPNPGGSGQNSGNPGTGNSGGAPVTITPALNPVAGVDGETPPSESPGAGFGGSINLPIGPDSYSPHPSGPIRPLPGQPGTDLVDPETPQPTTGADAAFPEPASLVLFAAGAALVIRRKVLRG